MTYRRRNLNFVFACCAALSLALPAAAQEVSVDCAFTVECFEAEPCSEASFTVNIGKGETAGTAVMQSPAETISGDVTGHDSTSLVWTARTPSAVHVLLWGPDGQARYTLHLTDGPAIVSYHGTCEAK